MTSKPMIIMLSAVLISLLFCFNPLAYIYSDGAVLHVDRFDDETNKGIGNGLQGNSDEESKSIKARIHQKSYSNVANYIKGYLSDKDGIYGVYFYSISSGQSFGINEDRPFIAASTVKVPINLYLYNRIAQNKVNPSKSLTYTKDDYEKGTGIIINEKPGKKYTIRELSRLSIVYSDNIAINMLIRYLGRNNIYRFMESIVDHPVSHDKNAATPKDMGLYLKALLNFSNEYEKHGEELLNYLKNTKFNDRMPLYLPDDVPIAHKIGTQIKAVHDVGIVFSDKPFILVVMSENVDEKKAPDVIGRITKMVYDFEQE